MLTNFYTSSLHQNNLGNNCVSLCLATTTDIELLRMWKNENTGAFFHHGQISVSQQEQWFNGYLQRANDYMFIASLNESLKFGCLGCRYEMGIGWDLYNIINGHRTTQRRGLMSVALKQLLDFCQCRPSSPITLKVVSGNPARIWYQKNGFVELEENAEFVVMKYNRYSLNHTA